MSIYTDMTIKELVEAREKLNTRDAKFRKKLVVIECELAKRMVA